MNSLNLLNFTYIAILINKFNKLSQNNESDKTKIVKQKKY